MALNENEIVFIRDDLKKTSTGKVAYYIISKEMVDFLNRIQREVGNIEGVILNKEKSQITFNLGFICGEKN